jgi:PAS domain-containing protein
VYALIDRVKMKFRQLTHAVTGGDDRLVDVIDRDIENSLQALLEARASSSHELYMQLRFMCELILENTSDSQSVRRSTSGLIALLDRTFQPPGSSLAWSVAPMLRAPRDRACEDDFHLCQAMLDAMLDQIVLVGGDSRVIFANRAFCVAHRLRAFDCIGKHFHEFEFGNGLPFDFEQRVEACFVEGWAATDVSVGQSYESLSPVEIRPFFLGDGPAAGVLITFRHNAVFPVSISS